MAIKEARLGLITIAEFGVKEVIESLPKPGTKNGDRKFKVDGKTYDVKMNSSRYYTFRDSLSCVCCGLKGVKFKLQRHPIQPNQPENRAHFNLFGIEKDGTEVMLTKDHIKPKSLGGPNSLKNYQTMCMICNGLKKNQVIPMTYLRKLKRDWVDNRQKNNGGTIRKREKRPAIGFVLWRVDATPGSKQLKKSRAGAFFDDRRSLATDKILQHIRKSKVEYYCSEHYDGGHRAGGVWPIFKTQPIRTKRPKSKGKAWGDRSKRDKDEFIGYEIMGWDQYQVGPEGKLYWHCPRKGSRKAANWKPTERKKDLMELERRLSELKLKRKYNKLMGRIRRPTLEARCDLARTVVDDEFGIE